jgi:hypothetical protein
MESLTQDGQAAPPEQTNAQNGTSILSSVPEDLRAEKHWANVKDVGDLARKYTEMVKYQGRSFSIPPPEKADEWGKVYDRLGRPKDATSYELTRPELPEGVTYNEPLEQAARAKFYELGLSAKQAQGLYNWFMEADTQAREAFGTRYEQGQADLNKEWGVQADANFALAQKGLYLLVNGNKEHPLVKWLDSTGETYNPVLIKFFHEFAKAAGEDNLAGLEEITGGAPMEGEIEQWEKEIANVRSDPKSAFSDPQHAGHKAEVERILGLYRKIRETRGEEG